MNKQRWIVTLLLAVGLWRAAGQTAVDLSRQGKLGAGTVLPVRCTVGQMFLKTDAPAGANLYVCTAAPGTWTITGMPALGGDATGTQQSLTVKGIQGRGISPASPADQYVLRWNAANGQWEPSPQASGMPLSSIVANPTVGGASDLTSFSWTVGHDDVASQPGWSDASAWLLNFDPSRGQQDYDNASKRTFNILKLHMSGAAAGQREGLATQVYGTGVGDIAGVSCLAVGGSQNSGGDEGTLCYRAEVADEMQATQRTLNTIPAQTTCGTGATITQAITKGTNPQTVTVSNAGGCNVGDHVIVARQPINTASAEEMIVLTGVSSGHITAKFSHDHASGATLSPATKLNVYDASPLGQFRWLRRVGHDNTTGTVSPAGNGVWTGTGTAWTASTFGGDSIAPGLISLDSDTNTQQAPGLRAWYLITGITDGTHLKASDGLGDAYYSGPGGSGTFAASCGGVIMGFDTPIAPGNLGPYVYLDTPPSVCGWKKDDIVEMTVPVRNGQGGVSVVLRSYAQAGIGSGSGFGTTNIGDVEKGSGFGISAPPYKYGDPAHPAYKYALQVGAPVEYGITFGYGITHEMLGSSTYPGYPAPISWGGQSGSLGTARLYPNTDTGDFWFLTHSGKFTLGDFAGHGVTLDTSNTQGNVLTLPNKAGTLLTDADVPIVTITKTLPAGVNNEIHLGAYGGYGARTFDIYATSAENKIAKRYTLAVSDTTTPSYQWIAVVPTSEDTAGSTENFALDLEQDGGALSFRLRKTAGTDTPDVKVVIYCYSNTPGNCTFTPSQASPGTVGPPVTYTSGTVLAQSAGHLATFGAIPSLSGCGSGASLSPNSNDEGGTLTLGLTPETCLVTFARAYSTYAPKCTVTFQAGVPGPYSLSTTAISIAATGLTGKVDYRCAQ